MRKILLGKTEVNQDTMPYIIAEVGVNHENSIDKAFELISLAKKGGANAVKFQTYKAEKIASVNSPSYWDLNEVPTNSQFKLFKKYDHFEENEYIKLANYAQKLDIEFISTPFDLEAVDFLNPLMNFYKIASADITNYPLLKKIASKKKPVILSTGASNIEEINNACDILYKNGVKEISLLHCILNYPTKDEDANLNMIQFLQDMFPKLIIGLSDHTYPKNDMNICAMSYVAGARIIEKHFTYDKSLKDNDHFHSMDITDLKILKNRCHELYKIMGKYERDILESEKISNQNARRSLVTKKTINKGQKIDENMIICKRPGTGISPIYLDQVIGLEINKDLKEDHILQWSDIIK
ncbi:MAG: acetylneuraminic acid synthetase [Pelagibacteraceae bacterium]|nr:acetylneuraminic acid synthetase [Pelagibacteraceae bacterium]